MKNDKFYIEQIIDAIRKIESYVKDFDKSKFFADEKTQSAVILQLTLIGEISKKLSQETKLKIAVPWKDIAGFRDKAIHDYFDVELNVVWDTVENDIPILKKELSNS